MYIHRSLEPKLLEALDQFPACLITGPRQAGKSTLLQHTLQKYRYVTLDDPLARSLAEKDPELFFTTYPAPLIIDEIQYVPNLLPYLKMRIDQKRHEYGQYVLTGSQTFQVMKGVSESLAGRIAIFHLYPLSWEEINSHRPVLFSDDFACTERWIRGFYPESFVQPNWNPNLWFGSYLSTYVERDVRNLKAIADLSRFQTFISLLAARAGSLLNLAEVAKECGISQPTAKDWISILESTYIISLLRPYHKNISKRLVKSPKLYFVDTGLLCYLLGIDTPERFFKAAERGHIFENMVIMEWKKNLSNQSGHSECYFYRTASGVEIDLLVERQNGLEAYEIKLAKTLHREMAASLSAFQKEHPLRCAKILSLSEHSTWLMQGVEAIHWSQGK